MKTLAFLIITGLLLAISPRVVLAQSESVFGPEYPVLEGQYRNLLEVYRTKRELYTVSVQQYYNLKTLASQEEAVRIGRDLFLTRVDVTLIYLNMLSQALSNRQTIDVQRRNEILGRLTLTMDELKTHRTRVDIATDRLKVDEEALWFSQRQKDYLKLVDLAQSLIKIGRMQESLDEVTQAKERIKNWVQFAPISETRRVEKRRGIDELERTLTAVADSLIGANALYEEYSTRSTTETKGSEISETLSKGYIKLLQGISFAKELSQ